MCTPTRHALMSGRYPINDGMQEHVIDITMPYGMPLELTTLPELLKTAGYRTHMLGFVYIYMQLWTMWYHIDVTMCSLLIWRYMSDHRKLTQIIQIDATCCFDCMFSVFDRKWHLGFCRTDFSRIRWLI